jgi:hypothetical protein
MREEAIRSGVQQVLGEPVELQLDRHRVRPWLDADDLSGVIPATAGDRTVVVKIGLTEGLDQTLIPWILGRGGIDLPQFPGSSMAAELSHTAEREPAAYALHPQRDVLPEELGRFTVDGQTALVLADIGAVQGLDPTGSTARWSLEQIEQALVVAAGFHAATAGRDYPWAPLRPSTRTALADVDLYRAILRDASRRLPDIVTPAVLEHRLELLDSLSRWHPAKDVMPATLVHNDFNQRNIGFRTDGRVVVLDWELARVDIPQRDVVELLTFTLDAHADVDVVLHLLGVHWQALQENGMEVEPEVYARAAAAEFRRHALDRVGMHLLFGAAFELPYLQRINRTVDHLVGLTAE